MGYIKINNNIKKIIIIKMITYNKKNEYWFIEIIVQEEKYKNRKNKGIFIIK